MPIEAVSLVFFFPDLLEMKNLRVSDSISEGSIHMETFATGNTNSLATC